MLRELAAFLTILFLAPAAIAQHLWIDASQFNQKDICADIQAAIAALPVVTTSPAVTAGIVIDARNFTPPSSGTLSCSVNPFAISSSTLPQNPVVLVAEGTGSGTSPTPGVQGGIVLLPGYTIATDVPWLVPQSWSIFGQGGRLTFLVPSGNFPNSLSSTGSVGTSGVPSTNVTGAGGASFTSKIVGSVLFACPSGCTAGYQTATSVGIVTYEQSTTSLYLGTAVTLSNGSPYVFQTPLLAWATTSNCTSACQGALQFNTAGSVIQDIGLDCTEFGQGMTTVPGCIPFWDEYGQERSQLKRIRVTNFQGLGIGIYTINAQNGGPFDDIQMFSGPGAIVAATTCVEVGGTGASSQPIGMRGIRGLTCTGPSNSPASVGTGIDINTQNFTLSDAHFEDFNVGVAVGDLTSARGVSISNITGGGSAESVNTVVDIFSACTTTTPANCQGFATSDINVQGVYQPTTGDLALVDNITGRPVTELMIGSYLLGDSATGASNRPVLTTSSTAPSSPNLLGMAAGIPITGVQGSTGTLVQMSTGTPVSGDLGSFDSNGNMIDSGIALFGIAASGQGGVWLPTFSYPISGLSNTPIGMTVKAIQLVLPTKITFTRMTAYVTASSSGSFNLGIYNASGGAKLADSGSISCGTMNAAVTSTISAVTLQPGVYFFAYAATDSTCAIGSLAAASQAEAIMNKVATRQGTSGNPLSGGSLPGSLGTITGTTIDPAVAFIEP